ncbi:MAG: hypothetical protein L3K23_10415 [Thermoplasmata archaeon]|nr:hypothetical protein [Thermoplasmata archaeon]
MKPSLLRVYQLTPKPCPHEEVGRPHPTYADLVECVLANGSPGFDLKRRGASPKRVTTRRSRLRIRARLLDAWGGYCGANAPPGVGCGANGRTPLEMAHLLPVGTTGGGRGWERRVHDWRNWPFAFCLLCRPCHDAFDHREDPWA